MTRAALCQQTRERMMPEQQAQMTTTMATGRTGFAGRRCLVLGGGGFIGTNLCRGLAAIGAEVTAYGAQASFPQALDGVAWRAGGFDDHRALADAIAGQAVVFHLIGAGVPAKSNLDPAGDLTTSTINTLHMLDFCRQAGVEKVIFVSSGGTVYGVPRTPLIAEDHPTDPISAYGVSKLAIEKYLGLYRHLHGLDYRVLRVANPYGPYQVPYNAQGVVASILQRALSGVPVEIWGDGEVVRDFVHIGDVVAALIDAVDYAGAARVLNVGSGVGRSVNQIVADVETVLGRGAIARDYKPSRPADVPVNVLDIALIDREMGWRPRVDWLAGLRETALWMEAWLAAQPPSAS